MIAQNVPLKDNAFLLAFKYSVVVSITKLAFSSLIVKPAVQWLVKYKYRIKGVISIHSPHLFPYFQSIATITLWLDVFTVLVCPLVAVFMIDAGCMRFFLEFAPDLQKLFKNWGIGVVGADAFRRGVCSRSLVSKYSYVFMTMALLQALFRPIQWLVIKPIGNYLKSELLDVWSTFKRGLFPVPVLVASEQEQVAQSYKDTHKAALNIQSRVGTVMSTIIMLAVFGPLVPPLLVAAPLISYVQLCAISWEMDHVLPGQGKNMFGVVMNAFE